MSRVKHLSNECQWDEQIAANTAMFRQADKLDDAAYKIIQDELGNESVWKRFSEAKTLADETRRAAYEDWLRIKREMNE
ncbi:MULTISPECIES: hypothetical protein [unclassified Pseudomonas]|uniref:hypothetical protein n=1 Tax=unclassified Pseudomonas TaxID=196821 RepID=UPI001032D394|nr:MULTISPECIES: hypothetical protein [unclassified Pseudomonas]